MRRQVFALLAAASLLLTGLTASAVAAPTAQSPTPQASAVDSPQDCSGSQDVEFHGNWECGTPEPFSPWDNIKQPAPIQDEPPSFQRVRQARQGDFAAEFLLKPGWTTSSVGSRSEVGTPPANGPLEGEDEYYALSVKFDRDWPYCDPGFCIFAQWHQYGFSGSPTIWLSTPYSPLPPNHDDKRFKNLTLFLRSGTCPVTPQECTTERTFNLMPKKKFLTPGKGLGVWHDFILHVRWDHTKAGTLELWHRVDDGQWTKPVSEHRIETLKLFQDNVDCQTNPQPTCPPLTTRRVEIRTGIYRGFTTGTTRLWNDSFCIANSLPAAKRCIDD